MRVNTPEIAWHGRDPIYSCAVQPYQEGRSPLRLATSGTDANIRMWYIRVSNDNRGQPEFASNLSRHSKAVNCVRWSPDGAILASGADDSCVILWRLSDTQSGSTFGKEDEEVNKEGWNGFKTLRGHLEDVYDLCWSSDGSRLISGSVDNSAIIWDIIKGEKLHLLKDHHSFVQGVAWDPQNVLCATMSCDRSLRIYNLKTQKCLYNIQKMPTTIINNNGESQTKQIRMFHDDTMKSFFRRIAFTPDGEILIAPAGILEMPGEAAAVNTTFLFTRSSLPRPVVQLPGPNKATVAVSCCPVLFELRKPQQPDASDDAMDTSEPSAEKCDSSKDDAPMETKDTDEKETKDADSTDNASKKKTETEDKVPSLFHLPYRMVFAVATEDSIMLYDTQQNIPFGMVSNIHYHQLSDLSWSSDGKLLVIASTDGYCTIITFDDEELGIPYKDPHKTEAADTKTNTQVKGESSVQGSSAVANQSVKAVDSNLTKDAVKTLSVTETRSQQPEVRKSSPVFAKTTSPPGNKGSQPRRIAITTLTSTAPSSVPHNDSNKTDVKIVDSNNLTKDTTATSSTTESKALKSPPSDQPNNKGSQPRRMQVTTLTSTAPSVSQQKTVAAPRRVSLTTVCSPPQSSK